MLLDLRRIDAEMERLRGPLFASATRGDEWVKEQEQHARRFLRHGLHEVRFETIDEPLSAVQRLVDHVFFAASDARLPPSWELLDAEAFFERRLVAAPLPLGLSVEGHLRCASDFMRWLGALGLVSSSASCEVVADFARLRVRWVFRLAS